MIQLRKKLGRNHPCWCGSGKKFKKCHLGRESQEKVPYWEAGKEFRKAYSKKLCSAPKSYHTNCSSKIIKAHTLPKALSLKAISRDGHVYGLPTSLESVRRNNGRIAFELIGVNRASTFSGFCSVHDDSIFAPIEKNEFFGSSEQCFLLAYRALAREFYTKAAMVNTSGLRKRLDRGKDLEAQITIQEMSNLMNIGAFAGLRDLKLLKQNFDMCLENSEFSSVRGLIFELDCPPPVMISTGVNPDFNFNGDKIQDLSNLKKVPDAMFITSFYDGKRGLIVFTWLENGPNACTSLIRSLLRKQKEQVLGFVFQYIFKNSENTYLSPDWWQTIDVEEKDRIIDLINDSVNTECEPNNMGLKSLFLRSKLPNLTEVTAVNFETKRGQKGREGQNGQEV